MKDHTDSEQPILTAMTHNFWNLTEEPWAYSNSSDCARWIKGFQWSSIFGSKPEYGPEELAESFGYSGNRNTHTEEMEKLQEYLAIRECPITKLQREEKRSVPNLI
ncbi:hypothetical protein J6590_027745 [Homalodisca vitripennis]|nr:hypothetical protein J6590_027745 [Homalodisca vitripennis]